MQRSPQQMTESSAGDSQTRLSDATTAKNVYFYKDGDTTVGALRVAVHPRKYRSMESLLTDLSKKIPGLSFGVRSIYTPGGNDPIKSVERLVNDGRYVCSTYKNKAQGIDVLKVNPPPPWHAAKPNSGQRELNNLIRNGRPVENGESNGQLHPSKARLYRSPRPPKRRFVYARSQATDSSGSRGSNTPKRIVMIKNTDHSEKRVILLNRRTVQTYEQVLMDVGELFRMEAMKVFTIEGMRIHSLSAIFNGPEHYVVCGKEGFRRFDDESVEGQRRKISRPGGRKRGGPTVSDYLREKRERLTRTRGRWRVWITTSEIANSSSSAQVSISVYGEKGNSGPIPLGDADDQTFQAGHVDEFENGEIPFDFLSRKNKSVMKRGEISVGNIGSIYKIRVAHDNSSEYPGWFCEEVAMRDLHTDEELIFHCNRWLSRTEDDSEICRELPAVRAREPVLPVLKYNVMVVTGDYWNAGTDAHVYMTIYGERGDTGVRQLIKHNNHAFQKGQSDYFQMEAVSLGALRRVIVGHDGDGPNHGWYLDKVVIKEGERAVEEFVFPCGRWLDVDEDDGKIVRELKIQDEYMHDQLEKEMWEYEKWKYGANCQIMLFSKLTKKAIRVRADGVVDGLGEVESEESVLNVLVRKGTARMLNSAVNGKYLTINDHKVTSVARVGPHCELKLKVQPDRSVKLQSLKYSVQHVSIRKDGYVGDPRATSSDPSTAFSVYCKGMFRDEGIIMLCTSMTQTVAIQHDNNLYGTGKRNRMAHFKVHKVSDGNVRMFESACFPDQYIRMKDGSCNCQGTGDSYCHFRVHRYRESGFVTLESVANRGLFIGLTPDGQIRPMVDTGEKNVRLYPEVLQFGRQRTSLNKRGTSPHLVKSRSPDLIPLTPPTARKSRAPKQQEKKDSQTTSENIEIELRNTSSPRERSRSRSKSPRKVKKKKNTPSPIQKEVTDYEAGDWKVWIETSETAVDGEVGLAVYGDKGSSGFIALGSTRDNQIFQAGRKDEFKVNLKSIGEIYKVRLELNAMDRGDIPTWQVREVRMQDQETKEVLNFKFNRWLSCLHDNLELMKELPAVRPKREVLPVVNYLIESYTGDEPGSDTDARVYITLYGQRGDSGKRLLNRGEVKSFEQGKVDLFEVEAVSLGHLTHCVLTHDGQGAGEGWFCKQIVVKETEDATTEYLFMCNQWLDSSIDDKKTERLLQLTEVRTVQTEDEEEIDESEDGDWRIWLLTGKEDDMGLGGSALVYAYGTNYHIGPIIIGSGADGVFQPGNLDEFKINLSPSMGELYKVRIGHDEQDVTGWYLEKVKMKNLKSKEVLTFPVNRWLARSRDDGDVWRELAVIRPGQAPLPVVTYVVRVYTGSLPSSDTDANVYMNIYGSRGDCGMRTLYKNINGGRKFQRGSIDEFHIEAVSLCDVEKILIGHDGEGAGAGWYLKRVVVLELSEDGDQRQKWFFPCQQWFDEGIGDKLVAREIAAVKPGTYTVSVTTNADSASPNQPQATITLYGNHGDTGDVILENGQANAFNPGQSSDFKVVAEDIGHLYKIRIAMTESADWDEWHIDEVILVEQASLARFVFKSDKRLKSGDGHEMVHEMPVVKEGQIVLPVYQYHVSVYSGDDQSQYTDASVHLRLVGKRGDTGDRLLLVNGQMSKKLDDGRQKDVFTIEAVDLSDVEKVVYSKGNGEKVYISHITVRTPNDDAREWLFSYNNYVGDDKKKEARVEIQLYDVRDVTPERELTVADDDKHTVGEWLIVVETDDGASDGASGQVSLVLCGRDGESQVFPLVNSDGSTVLAPGGIDEFRIDANKDLGPLFKLRLGWEDPKEEVSWQPKKISLQNMSDRSLRYKLSVDHTLTGSPSRDSWTEIPLHTRDNNDKKVEVVTYYLAVHTGDLDHCGTSGRVHVTLCGSRGTTGRRYLLQPVSANEQLFQDGQVDEFEVKAVSVLDLSNIVVGHDAYGVGAGWYLEKIIVRETKNDPKMLIFNCQRWLDEGENEGELEVELPLSDVQYEDKGEKWRAWALTGGGDQCPSVTMVIYGDEGQSPPLPLVVSESETLTDSQVDESTFYLNVKVGVPYKVRLSYAPQVTMDTTLLVKSVNLVHQESELKSRTFQCTTEKEMVLSSSTDGVVELPVQSKETLSVYNYLLTVYTGTEDGAGTQAGVHVTLYGERGDTGRRRLLKAINHEQAFVLGQMDMFEVEAVDLNHVTSVVVGVDSDAAGEGWFLDKIMVQARSGEEYLFLCGRWLDAGKDDMVTERQLYPEENQFHPWTIWLTTGSEKGQGFLGVAYVTVYGDINQSKQLMLGTPDGFAYEEGHTDEFQLNVEEDLGAVYKIRLGFDRKLSGPQWFVKEIKLLNKESSKEYSFEFNDWVKTDDNSDTWVEISANQDDPDDKLDLIAYQVEVHTGTDKDAGMTSPIYCQLIGSRGDSGRRELRPYNGQPTKFDPGDIQSFTLCAVDLADLNTLVIGLLDVSQSWYLEKVIVREHARDEEQTTFFCHRWLDASRDDGKTEITLEASKGGRYRVITRTGPASDDVEEEPGVTANLVLVIYGHLGRSQPRPLGGSKRKPCTVSAGTEDVFHITTKMELGDVYKIRIGFDNPDHETLSWYLENIKLIDENEGVTYLFEQDGWIRSSDQEDSWREIPVLKTDRNEMLSVIQYYVYVFTSDVANAGTDANVYLTIHGDRGDTGRRWLHRTLDDEEDHRDKFQTGQTDVFTISAVDLSSLTRLTVEHDGTGPGADWHLDKIVVKMAPDDDGEYYLFQCKDWIQAETGAALVQLLLTKFVDKPNDDELEDGDWRVKVYTGDAENASTDAQVSIVIFGDVGDTGEIPLGEPGHGYFQLGAVDEFTVFVDPESVGKIRKIRVQHDGDKDTSAWLLHQVVMENVNDLNQTLEFPVERWLHTDEDDGDTVREVAARWPDESQAPSETYVLEVYTGDLEGAGTHANVYVILRGQNGDSGRRYLRKNKRGKNKFETGKMAEFHVEAVDLGELYELVIGHDGRGSGSGWFLEKLIIRTDDQQQPTYEFLCDKWLDEDKDDNLTERVLKPTNS